MQLSDTIVDHRAAIVRLQARLRQQNHGERQWAATFARHEGGLPPASFIQLIRDRTGMGPDDVSDGTLSRLADVFDLYGTLSPPPDNSDGALLMHFVRV